MIKFTSLPKDIPRRLPDVERLLAARPEVIFAYLFGGFAEGKVGPLSDIDIAVYLSEDADPTAIKTALLGELSDLLRTDEIDLVILNTASLPLRARIIRKKRLLKDSDPFSRHRFESLALREYFDFSYREMQILTRRYSLG